MNLLYTPFIFGVGYYCGKTYSKEIEAIATAAIKGENPPISISEENVKIFGYKIINFEKKK